MKSDYYVVKFWQKSEHFYFLGLKGLGRVGYSEHALGRVGCSEHALGRAGCS